MFSWILISAILFFVSIAFFTKYDYHSGIKEFCVGISIFLVFTSPFVCVGVACMSEAEKTLKTESTYNIYSLKDRSSVSGSFFLGSGNVSGTLKYFYFVKNDSGAFINKSFGSDVSEIYEVDGTPQVVISTYTYRPAKWVGFLRYGFITERKFAQFYVPKGTVIQEFKVE